MKQDAAKGILGGICVSIGATTYLSIKNIYLATAMFFIGLWLILVHDLHLFTGRIGFLAEFKYIKDNIKPIFKTFIYNLIGIIGFALVFIGISKNTLNININRFEEVLITRSEAPFVELLLRGVICGFLVDTAITGYKRQTARMGIDAITPFLCVLSILFIGGLHCIADAFFISSAFILRHLYGYFNNILFWRLIIGWFLVVIGNGIGAMIWHRLLLQTNKGEKTNGFERSYTSETYRGFSD
jgi:formate/nitrite transporter FocA (FNT family)